MVSPCTPVATVLTACGIETWLIYCHLLQRCDVDVATVLTACGIETPYMFFYKHSYYGHVATVLTACGIETLCHF